MYGGRAPKGGGGYAIKYVCMYVCMYVTLAAIACVASVPVPRERNSGRAKEFFAFGPPRSFHHFAFAPFFARSECGNLFCAARISFASFGNVCYAGYVATRSAFYSVTFSR